MPPPEPRHAADAEHLHAIVAPVRDGHNLPLALEDNAPPSSHVVGAINYGCVFSIIIYSLHRSYIHDIRIRSPRLSYDLMAYLFYFVSVPELAPFLLVAIKIRQMARTHLRMRLHCIVKPFCSSFPTVRDDCVYEDPMQSFLHFLNTHSSVISGIRAMHAMSSAFMGGAPMELQIHIPGNTMQLWSRLLCAPGCYKKKTDYNYWNPNVLMWCHLARTVCVFEGIDDNIGKLYLLILHCSYFRL